MRAIFIAVAYGEGVTAGVQIDQKNRKIFKKEPFTCNRFFNDDFRMHDKRIFNRRFGGFFSRSEV